MEVLINKLDHFGNGIGRINDKVIFVKRGLVGEIVDVNVTKDKKKFMEGEIKEVVKASSSRIKSICPYYDKCGGCNFLHTTYQEEIRFKKEKAQELLGHCNEFYEIPAGIDDIHLSGKNKFNLANGNAFRFDGNTSEAVLQNRKKSNRKGAIIITVAAVIGFVIGFLLTSGAFASEPEEKVFIDEGLYIVLDDSFTKTNAEDFTLFYVSDDSAVIALREDFEATPQLRGLSLDEYAHLVIDVNNLTDSEVKTTDDGLVYYEYDSLISETNEKYKYYSFVYKSTDCFWLVQFSSLFENSESQREQIFEWARTVKFAE